METTIDSQVKNLIVGEIVIESIENKKNRNKPLDRQISALSAEVRKDSKKFTENRNVKAYEKFTSLFSDQLYDQPPGPKILTNLIIERGYLPTISRVVDAMNYTSIKNCLTVSIWDADKIKGNIVYKNSVGGEKYWPFMGEEHELSSGELAAFDDEKVLCLVRYRDSKYAPVELETKNIIVHIQGIDDIEEIDIKSALDKLKELLVQSVGGEIKSENIIKG